MKRQKIVILGGESPKMEGVQYATKEEWRAITSSSRKTEVAQERVKCLGQRGKSAQLWMCLEMKRKSDSVKNNIA